MLTGDGDDRERMARIEAIFEERAPKEAPVGIGRGGRVELELLKFREYEGYALYDGAGFGLIIPVISGVVTPVSLGLTAMRGPDETIYFTFEGARVAGAMGARLWIGKCWKQ